MQLSDFEFKTQPYDHQSTALLRSADKRNFALFMDMGTGKTKVSIDNAAYLYSQNLIDALVVVAPNGVHRNWVLNELPVHMPDHVDYKAHYYKAGTGVAQTAQWNAVFKHEGLQVFCFNVESASNTKGQKEMRVCVQTARTLLLIDESHCIKNPGTKRTKFLMQLGKYARYRRILSGSPITQSPLDLYAQFKFLDPTITGYTSNTAFRAHYAEIEQRKSPHKTKQGKDIYFEHINCYRNIDELQRRVAPYCYRVLKSECLDLPDKVYERVYVEITAEQKRVYKDLLDKSVAALSMEYAGDLPPELAGAPKEQLMLFYATSKITTKNAMVKLLRLQQVICGSMPDDDGNVVVLASNRLNVLKDLLQSIKGKVIIWARFKNDVRLIRDMLIAEHGADCLAEFHGSISTDDRMLGVDRFQTDDTCRYFLSNQHSGGTGLTLTAASDTVYYSNDFSAAARWQSEDRAHRIGQKNNVTYHDLICTGTVDETILDVLADKRALAEGFDYGAASVEPVGQIVQSPNQGIEMPMFKDSGIVFEDDAWQ